MFLVIGPLGKSVVSFDVQQSLMSGSCMKCLSRCSVADLEDLMHLAVSEIRLSIISMLLV